MQELAIIGPSGRAKLRPTRSGVHLEVFREGARVPIGVAVVPYAALRMILKGRSVCLWPSDIRLSPIGDAFELRKMGSNVAVGLSRNHTEQLLEMGEALSDPSITRLDYLSP